MRKQTILILAITLLSISLAASCGWKPKVTATPITAPWSEMNLPVKENAVVWKSLPNEFRAVHKDDKQTVMKNYTEALKAQGFALGKFDKDSSEAYTAEFTKGADKYSMRVYDFDNTGVGIEKK